MRIKHFYTEMFFSSFPGFFREKLWKFCDNTTVKTYTKKVKQTITLHPLHKFEQGTVCLPQTLNVPTMGWLVSMVAEICVCVQLSV